MTRLRAMGYGALVAVVVFYYLAVPTLRDLVGPEVVLPAYAAVAVLAGAATYHAIRFVSGRKGARDGASRSEADETRSPARPEPADANGVDRGDDGAVEEMLEELEAERDE